MLRTQCLIEDDKAGWFVAILCIVCIVVPYLVAGGFRGCPGDGQLFTNFTKEFITFKARYILIRWN